MSNIFERLVFQQTQCPNTSFENSSREYEIEVYVEGLDIEAIASQSTHKEEQEQWGAYVPKTDDNISHGSIRVRRTLTFKDKNTEPELNLVLTVKTAAEDGGAVETNVFVGSETFSQFAAMADQGLVKTRYYIPFKFEELDLIAEVDTFLNKAGEQVPWTKIDIEYPEGTDYSTHPITPAALPEVLRPSDPSKVHVVTPSDANDSDVKKKVKKLYDQYFCSKNKHL